MANNKKRNKQKHNKKIQQKNLIQKKELTIKSVEIEQKKPNHLPKEKQEKKHLTKWLLIPLLIIIILLLPFNKQSNKETKKINFHYLTIDINEFNQFIKLIKEENFQYDNLSRYLEYLDKYDIPFNYIILIINNDLYDLEYNDSIKEIIEHQDFIESNFKRYLEYLDKYDTPINYLIFIINNNFDNLEYNNSIKKIIEHKDFIEDNFKRYLEYLNKYNLSVDKTILAVNLNLDKDDIKLDKTVENFMKQKYYIDSYLKRYLNYYKKYNNLSYKEVITRVNSNLDKTFYKDIDKADTSKGNLILVNKYYYLSSNYEPTNLVSVSSEHGRGELKKVAYDAFKTMYEDAKKEGLYLYISSPYRSYSRQNTLYKNYVKADGTKEADRYSARPGYSEHQTGLAFDLGTAKNHSINDFVDSDEFKWVSKNAHKYGFILRYPLGKTYITGYIYEPWHYRYVGVDVATYIYKNNITYEEYYAYFVQ